MTLAAILAQIALFLWFFGCIRTYRFGKHLLVEGMGVKSAEFVMLCLFTASAAPKKVKQEKLEGAMDQIRKKYGSRAIIFGACQPEKEEDPLP